MAQFLVANNLTEKEVVEKAGSLSFPSSVVEYFQGYLGIPPFGFPEPLRSKVLAGRKLPNGKMQFEGRPGAEMPPLNFEALQKELQEKYEGWNISEGDVVSSSQYPKVFDEYKEHRIQFGDVSVLDTRTFVEGMVVGQEISFELEKGKTLFVRLKHISDVSELGTRDVTFEMNGAQRVVKVKDLKSGVVTTARPRADPRIAGSIGTITIIIITIIILMAYPYQPCSHNHITPSHPLYHPTTPFQHKHRTNTNIFPIYHHHDDDHHDHLCLFQVHPCLVSFLP